ncbi:TonB-dependent receptor [Flavobacteriaceae bacterium F89]|uniref:TonB-dependent receptor n=1 Tax=Cerina litoralis TaxID=2874477 RepID=A0AAE3EVY6_9FLAO|nr:TonB-dependent receptor [Cerina litoralis]MCG2462035.1 TonB-dependent receptor [Cerina litoralis]
MLTDNSLFLFLVLLLGPRLYAQTDSIIALDEVLLSDARLGQFSSGIKIETLNDSVVHNNSSTLTDLLQYNSSIYIKENGYGMVSSVSFRGTNAQQTAVIWNGININSQFNGQTDFNTISTPNYDNISVRSGGGSVQYGSGAVGGSVHLNNTLLFQNHFDNRLRLDYGSFNTAHVNYGTSFGNEKLALNLNFDYRKSDNDYKYLGTDRRNENGAFENFNLGLDVGYFLSESNLMKFYQNTFVGDRDFSGTLTAPSNDNYKDLTSRSLLEWSNFNDKKVARLKFAHLYERYRYYANKNTDNYDFGESNNFIINYDYKYRLGKITVNGILDFNTVKAKGSSINTSNRNVLAGIFLMSHRVTDKIKYDISIRKELNSDYNTPLVYAVNGKYDITDGYTVNLNTSKNFRVPTFNDLYWVGAGAAGNEEVVPEASYQVELGQNLGFKSYKFNITGYAIWSDDLIQWQPDVSGIWTPVNINRTRQYGLELQADVDKQFGSHQLLWKNSYTYTRSIDLKTDYDLIYVPEHKFNSNLAYEYKKWGGTYQFLYNGPVYITTDNTEILSGYTVSNIGLFRNLHVNRIDFHVAFNVNNLFNANYQSVAYRPMPNRNFQIGVTTKF